jgi:hypothetical protein
VLGLIGETIDWGDEVCIHMHAVHDSFVDTVLRCVAGPSV